MTEYHLRSPLSEADVQKLVAGDMVFLSGASSPPVTKPMP